jgi:hypothetical protein
MKHNIRRPYGPRSFLPIKIDSIIKQYFNRYRNKRELPPIIQNHISGRHATKMPKTLSHTFSKGITLWGRPYDYLITDDGYVVVLDHKTKSKEPTSIHQSHILQMNVHTYLRLCCRGKFFHPIFSACCIGGLF